MKRLMPLLLFSVIFISAICFAQVNPNQNMPRDYTIIPPSPEVSSLMKYVEIPVSYCSGLPQIELPLYELKEGKLSVPISLNYHGGGIKVNELEGDVGLGWALLAGGCISRTVYGHPDDIVKNIIGRNSVRGRFNATSDDNNLRNYIRDQTIEYDPGSVLTIEDRMANILQWNSNYEEGLTDMANDVFQINCMGISGTFIYDDSRNITLSSPSAISISPTSTTYNGRNALPSEYIVTDLQGTKYHFSHKEYTCYEFSTGTPGLAYTKDSVQYVSAWHLTKIRNIENDSIIFHYVSKAHRSVNLGGTTTQYFSSNETLKNHINPISASSGITHYYPEILSAIESNSAIVRLKYNDNNNIYRITKLSVHTNNDNNKTFKQLLLTYDNSSVGKSLLKNVLERYIHSDYDSIDSSSYNHIYSFGYYQDNLIPFSSHSSSQDFCGYYNGVNNSGCLVPSTGNPFMQTCGANRDVSILNAPYGSLTSITYPTGGQTIFEWEPHSFGFLHNIPVTKHSNTTEEVIKTETLVYRNDPTKRKLVIDNYVVGQSSSISLDLSKYFAINPQHLMLTDYYNSHGHNSAVEDVYPRIVILNKATNQVVRLFYIDNNTVTESAIPLSLSPGSYKIELRNPVEIDGTDEYFLRNFNDDFADCGKINIYNSVMTSTSTSVYKDYWGGLRIAKIKSIASEGDEIIKSYVYGEGDLRRSTGAINAYPYYNSNYTLVARNPEYIGFLESNITGISANGHYRTPVGGQRVEYRTVWESYIIDRNQGDEDKFTNMRVQYNYATQYNSSLADYNPSSNLFKERQPIGAQMWTSKAHRRGLLESKTMITLGRTHLTTSYKYNIYENSSLSTFTTELFKVADYTNFPIANGGIYEKTYGIGKYQLIPYNKTIAEERVDYTSYGDDPKLKNKINYTYFYNDYTSNMDYGLVRSKIITTAEGKTKEIFYTYLYSGSSFINLPETEVTVVDGVIISAKRMEYNVGERRTLKAVYGLNTRGLQASPYQLGSSKLAEHKILRIISKPEYSYRYDNEGNLAEISYNGVVLASFLWGYRGAFPIAEIKGLPYDILVAEIPKIGMSCPESFLSSTASTEPSLSNNLKALRSLFSTYDVTTMTYHWLIGVSSATDSRGISTHFTYDDFGRLSDVKDYNQHFIRKYNYNHSY